MTIWLYGGIALSALITAAFFYAAVRLRQWEEVPAEATEDEALFFDIHQPDRAAGQVEMMRLRKKA